MAFQLIPATICNVESTMTPHAPYPYVDFVKLYEAMTALIKFYGAPYCLESTQIIV